MLRTILRRNYLSGSVSTNREGVIAEVRTLSKHTPSETILILKIFKLTKKKNLLGENLA